jgi:magnesium transporter
VEDARSELEYPKVESYGDHLYLVLHGIDAKAADRAFATHDVDFFLGSQFLVTVHDGTHRSIGEIRTHCERSHQLLAEGPVAVLHRIVDSLVDHYMPEVDALEERLDAIEIEVLSAPGPTVVKALLALKRDVGRLRRIALPQRDAIGRLARREFDLVPQEFAYRFRDVYDHLVRITDEALIFQDRVTGILEAHLSNVSNQLNEVMKVLTLIATTFMPLSVLTGFFGMNVLLPSFPGGAAAQFWWLGAAMLAVSGVMIWYFKRQRWL